MKKLFLVIPLSLSIAVYSQSALINSSHCYGGSGSELSNDVSQTYDGNYLLAGYATSTDGDIPANHAAYDFWVCKVDNAGNVISKDNYGGSADDLAETVEETADSGRIVFGTTYSSNIDVVGAKGNADFWLVRLKKNGGFLWRKCFGGTMHDVAGQLSMGPDNSYYCAGKTNSKNGNVVGKHKLNDAWVIRVNDSGVLLWQNCIGGLGDDEANSIYTTADGGCIIAGSTNNGGGDVGGWHGGKDFLVSKLTSDGAIEWTRTFGGSSDDIAYAVVQTPDGGYIITGSTTSNDFDVTGYHGGTDVWVIKIDSGGSLEWQKSFGGIGEEIGRDVIQTMDGGYAISASLDGSFNSLAGANFSTYHAGYDYWVIKTDALGDIDWNGTYGAETNDVPFSILQNDGGELVVAGYANMNGCDVTDSHGTTSDYGDYWLLILGEESCGKPTSLSASSEFGSATMGWCQVAGAVSYELKYRPTGGSYTTVITTDGNMIEHTISVLPATQYEWRVKTNCIGAASVFTPLQYFTTPARSAMSNDIADINIFPNPAHNSIQIVATGSNAEIYIYDMNGSLISTDKMDASMQMEKDISLFPNGMYLVVLNNGLSISTSKFVKE